MRDMTGYTFEEITKSTPERSLLLLRSALVVVMLTAV
jgi:hypothetical protein